MSKYAFITDDGSVWVIEAETKDAAIRKAVDNGMQDDLSSFYYGLENGYVTINNVTREIS